jgi:hypothetical protein
MGSAKPVASLGVFQLLDERDLVTESALSTNGSSRYQTEKVRVASWA